MIKVTPSAVRMTNVPPFHTKECTWTASPCSGAYLWDSCQVNVWSSLLAAAFSWSRNNTAALTEQKTLFQENKSCGFFGHKHDMFDFYILDFLTKKLTTSKI